MEKKLLKMEQFFVSLKTISFQSFKQRFDADAALDGNLLDFRVFHSSLGLFIT